MDDLKTNPQSQLERITNAMGDLDTADVVYLIDIKWWRGWCAWSKYPTESAEDDDTSGGLPSAIDNTSLCDPEFAPALNRDCSEGYHFEYITKKAWDSFVSWFGGGENVFKRYRVLNKLTQEKKISLFPLLLRVTILDEETGKVGKRVYRQFQRTDLLETIFFNMQDEFKKGKDTRLRVPFRIASAGGTNFVENEVPEDFDKETLIELTRESDVWKTALEALGVKNDDEFQFEFRKGDKKWPSSITFKPSEVRVGTVSEGRDRYSKWYHMWVIGEKTTPEKGREFRCHWLGFKPTWDEWIKADEAEKKFAAMGAHSVEQKWFPKAGQARTRPATGTGTSTYRSHGGSSLSSGSSTSFKSSTKSTYTYGRTSYYRHQEGTPFGPGICGLRNLGNTCFMNSVVQCFLQTPALANYFAKELYKSDINLDNPLGHKGNMAKEWAELVKATCSGKYRVVVPIDFKKAIGTYAPQFLGFQQQDSQELLSFLVDGIHEDLNRIKKKPYIEDVEVGDRSLLQASKESWQNHKKRNSSVIVDYMHGQLKSRVECPVCDRVSIKFDPYSNLSLPIPTENTMSLIITYIPHNPPPDFEPMSYGVKVPKNGRVKDLKNNIIEQLNLTDVKPDQLIICDVYRGKINKLKKDNEPVSRMKNPTLDDFFVYNCQAFNRPSDAVKETDPVNLQVIPVCMRKPGQYASHMGIPLAMCLNLTHPYSKEDLVEQIKLLIQPYLSERVKEKLNATSAGNTESGMDVDPFDLTSLFEIKFMQTSTATHYSYAAKPWEQLQDVKTCEQILLCWKDVADYNDGPSIWRQRKKDPSCQVDNMKKNIDLAQCFENFTITETLKDDNLWYCSTCKEHREAKKTMTIWTVPDILVVHLKRFSYTRYSRNKISSTIQFPLEGLNIYQWMKENPEVKEENCIYDLYGVSNHSGSLGGGHYTAQVKNRQNGEWYTCNDSNCYRANKSSIVSSEAYLLFYQRRNADSATPRGGPAPQGTEWNGATGVDNDTNVSAERGN